jgi:hypothetical protein
VTPKERSKRIRRAIHAHVSRRAMTLAELAVELDHLADEAKVKRELLVLCRQDVVLGRYEDEDRVLVYESWDRVVARLKERRLRSVAPRPKPFRARRVA